VEPYLWLCFLGAFSLVLALGQLLPRSSAARRLERIAGPDEAGSDAESALARDSGGLLERLVAPFAPRGARARAAEFGPLRRRLVQAGYRRPSATVVYTGSRVALAGLLAIAALAAPLPFELGDARELAALVLAAGLGFALPGWWVAARRRRRQDAIDRGLPDALDLMVVCVEAGLGMNAGLARVSRELAHGNAVLAEELGLVTLEVRAGKSTTEALRGLAARTGLSDVSALVAMLIQTERFGTRLSDTLRVHADAIRSQRIQRAEEDAQKAPLRMLFPAGVLIFPATLAVTIGPGLMQLFRWLGDKP
jgi:tight adherence protein C